jgi:hypothetical protein
MLNFRMMRAATLLACLTAAIEALVFAATLLTVGMAASTNGICDKLR